MVAHSPLKCPRCGSIILSAGPWSAPVSYPGPGPVRIRQAIDFSTKHLFFRDPEGAGRAVLGRGGLAPVAVMTEPQTLGFQAETRQLLGLMTHALYGNREIFLRELISNASDAGDRLRFAALEDDSLYEGDADLRIRVEYDKGRRTISVIDNGIGLSRAEAVENLGTIARSGSKEFAAALSGEDSPLIGQFGVGFYSAFVVAEKVEVTSRRAGLARSEGVRWTSRGESEFSVATVDRPRRGTRVVLYLREDMDEFLDGQRLRTIIRKYSDHISLPIQMPSEDGERPGEDTVNNTQALWRRNKKELGDEDYKQFYRHITHDFEDPLAWSHNRVYCSFLPARPLTCGIGRPAGG